MESTSWKLEALLGVVVLAVAGLFVWLSVQVGGGAPAGAAQYELLFDSALGLTDDNAVAIAGVKVGVVQSIGIEGRQARVVIAVDPEVKLHENARAAVRSKTLLGEKYLDLDPGDDTTGVLPIGARLTNTAPTVEIDEVIRSASELVASMNAMTAPLGEAIGRFDDMLQTTEGKEVAVNLAQTLDDLSELIQETSLFIRESKGDVQSVLALTKERGPTILNRVEHASERLDKLLAAIDPVVVQRVTKRLDPASEDAVKVLGEMKGAMTDVKAASKRLDGVLARLDRALARTDGLNERAIREFLQVEGVRVNLIPDAKVERRLRKLRNEASPLPVP